LTNRAMSQIFKWNTNHNCERQGTVHVFHLQIRTGNQTSTHWITVYL